MRIPALAIAALALLAGPAAAQDTWREAANGYDLQRLYGNESQLAEAIAEARRATSTSDLQVLDALVTPDAMPIDGEALIGDWQCRTIKLGGLSNLVVYGWFKCRISYGAEGLYFEKLTGSQRTTGYLWPDWPIEGEGPLMSFVYLGVSNVGSQAPAAYNSESTLEDVSENRSDPGILEVIGRDRVRIGFPRPIFESKYDFLELRR